MMVRGLVRLPRLLATSKAPQVSRPWASCGYHQQHSGDGEGSQFNPSNFWGPAVAAAVGIGAAILWKNSESRKLLAEELKVSRVELGVRKEGLPEFSMEEVGRNSSTEGGGRVWVTYKDGVYDITDFIPLHPGATKLLMAAGGSVEPFWAMYAVHLNNAQVAGLLEQYRIGNLSALDAEAQAKELAASDSPFAGDPKRHPALVVNAATPYNAETPLELITESFITPADLFYVRNHLPVPVVDPDTWELEVTGLGVKKELTISLEELKTKFKKHEIVAAIQCGGNRRKEMKDAKPLKGLDWRGGAIGNAQWGGALLSDVLKEAGFSMEECQQARHVIFEGLDIEPDNSQFGGSITIEKATDPRGDVLLAYEMNGAPLTRDHGFPVRAVVPGVVGARNVKWLSRVEVSEEESESHHQRADYKGFNPSVDWGSVNWDGAESIQDMPVTSKISKCVRCPESPDHVLVAGYAWAGGGRKILRVDLTGDGGESWTQAHSLKQDSARHPRHWGWTLWEGRVKVGESGEVWSKAVDSSFNVQPESFVNIWNLRGMLSNAYSKMQAPAA